MAESNPLAARGAGELAGPRRAFKTRHPWLGRLVHFLVVFGPGLIVMEADNDAGAVSTYVQAGAQYDTLAYRVADMAGAFGR